MPPWGVVAAGEQQPLTEGSDEAHLLPQPSLAASKPPIKKKLGLKKKTRKPASPIAAPHQPVPTPAYTRPWFIAVVLVVLVILVATAFSGGSRGLAINLQDTVGEAPGASSVGAGKEAAAELSPDPARSQVADAPSDTADDAPDISDDYRYDAAFGEDDWDYGDEVKLPSPPLHSDGPPPQPPPAAPSPQPPTPHPAPPHPGNKPDAPPSPAADSAARAQPAADAHVFLVAHEYHTTVTLPAELFAARREAAAAASGAIVGSVALFEASATLRTVPLAVGSTTLVSLSAAPSVSQLREPTCICGSTAGCPLACHELPRPSGLGEGFVEVGIPAGAQVLESKTEVQLGGPLLRSAAVAEDVLVLGRIEDPESGDTMIPRLQAPGDLGATYELDFFVPDGTYVASTLTYKSHDPIAAGQTKLKFAKTAGQPPTEFSFAAGNLSPQPLVGGEAGLTVQLVTPKSRALGNARLPLDLADQAALFFRSWFTTGPVRTAFVLVALPGGLSDGDDTGLMVDELSVMVSEQSSRAADIADAAGIICRSMASCWLPATADAFVKAQLAAWLADKCTEFVVPALERTASCLPSDSDPALSTALRRGTWATDVLLAADLSGARSIASFHSSKSVALLNALAELVDATSGAGAFDNLVRDVLEGSEQPSSALLLCALATKLRSLELPVRTQELSPSDKSSAADAPPERSEESMADDSDSGEEEHAPAGDAHAKKGEPDGKDSDAEEEAALHQSDNSPSPPPPSPKPSASGADKSAGASGAGSQPGDKASSKSTPPVSSGPQSPPAPTNVTAQHDGQQNRTAGDGDEAKHLAAATGDEDGAAGGVETAPGSSEGGDGGKAQNAPPPGVPLNASETGGEDDAALQYEGDANSEPAGRVEPPAPSGARQPSGTTDSTPRGNVSKDAAPPPIDALHSASAAGDVDDLGADDPTGSGRAEAAEPDDYNYQDYNDDYDYQGGGLFGEEFGDDGDYLDGDSLERNDFGDADYREDEWRRRLRAVGRRPSRRLLLGLVPGPSSLGVPRRDRIARRLAGKESAADELALWETRLRYWTDRVGPPPVVRLRPAELGREVSLEQDDESQTASTMWLPLKLLHIDAALAVPDFEWLSVTSAYQVTSPNFSWVGSCASHKLASYVAYNVGSQAWQDHFPRILAVASNLSAAGDEQLLAAVLLVNDLRAMLDSDPSKQVARALVAMVEAAAQTYSGAAGQRLGFMYYSLVLDALDDMRRAASGDADCTAAVDGLANGFYAAVGKGLWADVSALQVDAKGWWRRSEVVLSLNLASTVVPAAAAVDAGLSKQLCATLPKRLDDTLSLPPDLQLLLLSYAFSQAGGCEAAATLTAELEQLAAEDGALTRVRLLAAAHLRDTDLLSSLLKVQVLAALRRSDASSLRVRDAFELLGVVASSNEGAQLVRDLLTHELTSGLTDDGLEDTKAALQAMASLLDPARSKSEALCEALAEAATGGGDV